MIDPFGNQLRSDIAKALWQFDHDNYRNGAQHWPDYESAQRSGALPKGSWNVNGTWLTLNYYETYAHMAMVAIDAKERGNG
jgi:hypothetical protein